MVVTSCMKWETEGRVVPLCGGSALLPLHAFLTSLCFWFLIFSGTESSSPGCRLLLCVLTGKKRHKRDVCPLLYGNSLPTYWFVFGLTLLFQIIFFSPVVWLSSTWKVEWTEIHHFWGEGENDLHWRWKLLSSFRGKTKVQSRNKKVCVGGVLTREIKYWGK